jgi:hypothetical protein
MKRIGGYHMSATKVFYGEKSGSESAGAMLRASRLPMPPGKKTQLASDIRRLKNLSSFVFDKALYRICRNLKLHYDMKEGEQDAHAMLGAWISKKDVMERNCKAFEKARKDLLEIKEAALSIASSPPVKPEHPSYYLDRAKSPRPSLIALIDSINLKTASITKLIVDINNTGMMEIALSDKVSAARNALLDYIDEISIAEDFTRCGSLGWLKAIWEFFSSRVILIIKMIKDKKE